MIHLIDRRVPVDDITTSPIALITPCASKKSFYISFPYR